MTIWIVGSYGTGKTFASFVIKHILEDEPSEVEKYFRHPETNSLWQRVAEKFLSSIKVRRRA